MAKKSTQRTLSRTRGTDSRRAHPTEEQLIACLRGESKDLSDVELRALFGDEFDALRELAKQSKTRGRTRGTAARLYLLHGIMGSELGKNRALWWDDVIWLGPIDILTGGLKSLRLDGGHPEIHSLGFLPGVYLKMRLQLEREGYDVRSYHFDWRLNLKDLGAKLKAEVEKEKTPVKIVAHSMGGLVTRAAIQQGMKNYDCFIMLAVPNRGSLAPVEALRGQYELANWIAAADPVNSGEELAQDVFCTFPGLHQMILHNDLHPGLDLHKLTNWPQRGPRPSQNLLALADSTQDLLAEPPDAATTTQPWYLIAGTGVETKVSARVQDDEFQYEITSEGDGTVPLQAALVPGVKTWFAYGAGHGFFANNEIVRHATVDILRTGTTDLLATKPPMLTRASRTVSESQLRDGARRKTSTRGESASFLDKAGALLGRSAAGAGPVNAPPADRPQASGYVHRIKHVTVGRRRARRLEIQLYNGSITEVDARAYVLGTFAGVAPSGAALALDKLMSGSLTDLIGGNLFGSRKGEVFILPLARRSLRAETAVFVGLGAYDEFKTLPVPAPPPDDGRPVLPTSRYINDEHVPVLEIACENAMRTLARTYVEDFATVMLGGTLSSNEAASGESMLRGFLRGLDLSDPNQKMRCVTICETNTDRYRAIRDHLFFLASTPLCAGIELDITELDPLPPTAVSIPPQTRGNRTPGKEPVYLTVRTMPLSGGEELWRFTPLGTSANAAIRERERKIDIAKVEALIKAVPNGGNRTPTAFTTLNTGLIKDVLPAEIVTELQNRAEHPLVILHDASRASRVPWEALKLSPNAEPTAIATGLTRRFIASSTDCLRWSAPAQPGQRVNVLIIGNPTKDLDSAQEEADTIISRLRAKSQFNVDVLLNDQATQPAVLKRLESGNYDIVHYSGHAGFDDATKRSWLKLADDQKLFGTDLTNIPRLPFLMVLNACESARTRNGEPKPEHSIAESLLCSGVGNLIGTYWEVFDDSARDFALELYTELIGGSTLGTATRKARASIAKTADWANYELFGNPDATLRDD